MNSRVSGRFQRAAALLFVVVGVGLGLAATPVAEAATAKKSTRPSSQKTWKKPVAAKKSSRARSAARAEPPSRSHGQSAGLHRTDDPLSLRSSVALVIEQDTGQILFSKNPDAVLPIASITKLMTAMIVTEAGQPLDEELQITQDDVDTEKCEPVMPSSTALRFIASTKAGSPPG